MKKTILSLVAICLANIASYAESSTNSDGYQVTFNASIVAQDGNVVGFDLNITGLSWSGDISAVTIESAYTCPDNPEYEGLDLTVKELGDGTKAITGATSARKITELTIKCQSLTTINALAFSTYTKVTAVSIETTAVPTAAADAFPSAWATSCTLTVPAASLSAYKTAWGAYFKSIVADGEVPTAISSTNDKISIRAVGKSIVLDEEAYIQVYSITGANIFSGTSDNVTVKQNGIYIVKTANGTQKVAVK